MNTISFKDYFESKLKLKEAIKDTPLQESKYFTKKYCKIPLIKSLDEKEYIALKPKDKVTILWEYLDINYPTPKSIIINDDGIEFLPVWNNEKMFKWVTETLKIINKI